MKLMTAYEAQNLLEKTMNENTMSFINNEIATAVKLGLDRGTAVILLAQFACILKVS